MRRPLCAAALLYCLAVLALLQIMPPQTEDYSAYHKMTVTLEGTVVTKEYKTSSTDGSVRLLITLKNVSVEGWEEQPEGKVMCRVGDGTAEDAQAADELAGVGARVRITGTLYTYAAATNSGEFDTRQYYQILGYTSFQVQYAELSACGTSLNPLGNTLYRVKRYLASVLDACLTQDDASVLKAMLLGEKGSLSAEMKSLYQDSGIIHILAISGLHISIIGMGLFRLFRKITVPLPVSAAAAVIVMLLYGGMTGMSASAFRAIVMFLLNLAAKVLRRTYDMLTAISTAGLLLLISQPLYLYHAGFLFSFSAVLGIALLTPVFTSKTMKALSVTLATLPVHLGCYYTFPVYSIVLNLLVLPLMSTVMVSGLIVLALGSLWLPAGSAAGIFPHVILLFYEAICNAASLLPGHRINVGAPAAWQIILYLLILGLIVLSKDRLEAACRKWVHRREISGRYAARRCREEGPARPGGAPEKEASGKRTLGKETLKSGAGRARAAAVEFCARHSGFLPEMVRVLAAAAAVLLLCFRFHTGLSLHVMDVGQGDGILIRCSDANILIDGGSTSKSSVGEYQITPLLQYYGVGRIDYVIITHPDSDHTSGALQIIEESRTHASGWQGILTDDSQNGITIGTLCLPSAAEDAQDESYAELIAAAQAKNIPVIYLKEGDVLSGGTLRLTCLHPEEDSAYEDANEMSLTLYLEYGAFTALLTGDLEGEGEERLLEYVRSSFLAQTLAASDGTIPITLLKVAHHGSQGATSEEFLDVFRPTLAVISCGVNNSYGHPHEATLGRLSDAGVAAVYDTRYGGEITFHTDGKTVRITQYGGELQE